MSSSGILGQIQNTQNSWLIKYTDLQQPFVPLFLWTLGLGLLALLFGGFLDSAFTKWQGLHNDRWECGLFFLAQISIDIFLILVVARGFLPFLPWLQLSISGVIAAVVFFAVQQQMVNNALCLTSF